MKPISIRIDSPQTVTRAKVNLDNLDLSKGPYRMDVQADKGPRSLPQNRLYRLWVNIICDDYGWEEEDLIFLFKEKFLVPMLLEFDEETQQTAEALRKLKPHKQHQDSYQHLRKVFVRESTTTKLNTKRFSDYLDKIDRWAIEKLERKLPVPDDLRR